MRATVWPATENVDHLELWSSQLRSPWKGTAWSEKSTHWVPLHQLVGFLVGDQQAFRGLTDMIHHPECRGDRGWGGDPIRTCTCVCSGVSDLCDSMDCSPPSMVFSRQEYWSGFPFPSPGDLSNPGIKSVSPAFTGSFFTTGTTWEAWRTPSFSTNQCHVRHLKSMGGNIWNGCRKCLSHLHGNRTLSKGALPPPPSLYWICYSSVSVLCVGFLAARHVGSLAPMPGIKSEPPALEDNVLTSGPSRKSLKGLFNTSDWTGFYMKADI